jgi:hypothetical protein
LEFSAALPDSTGNAPAALVAALAKKAVAETQESAKRLGV